MDTSRGDCLAVPLTMQKGSKEAELELSACLRTGYIAERTGSIVAYILNHYAQITSLHLMVGLPFILKGDTPIQKRRHAHSRPPGMLSLSIPSPSMVVRISALLDIMKTNQGLESPSPTFFLFIEEDCPLTRVHPPILCRLSFHECNSATIHSRLPVSKTTVIDIMLKNRRIRGHPSIRGVYTPSAPPPSLLTICALEETTKQVLEEDGEWTSSQSRFLILSLVRFIGDYEEASILSRKVHPGVP